MRQRVRGGGGGDGRGDGGSDLAARGQVGVEDLTRDHTVRHGHIVVRVVMHADLIARQHARWAGDGDRLNRVGVAEWAAAALVGLTVEQPAVDAPAVRWGWG